MFQRPPFVGRTAEFERLRAGIESATEGRCALIMLVGEPGIGKTALCERIAEHVTALGGRSLVGHCYEGGSPTLPYLPFVEALRAYVQATDTEALRAQLGSGAPEIARIVDDVRQHLDVELRPPGDPEQDRWRLLRAVTDFLRNAAMAQPLLLVLEDLHDADHGTLDLLLFLARNVKDAHLLVLGTYRDVEVDRVHPLSAALAELRRAAPIYRLPLRGLAVEDVQQLLDQLNIPQAGSALAEGIQRQTEGNPLFVQELARHMLEEGNGHAPTAILTNLPEGLRDVIGKRLSRLSASTNEVLGVAAVIGREFRLDVLHALTSRSETELDSVIHEATAAGVIEERSSFGGTASYRFAHALFRQALYEDLIAPRRIRLHQQVARALEHVYSRRPDEHAAELAEHYAFSSDAAELGKAVAFGEVAARHATSVYAYGEAQQHLQRTLQIQELLDPNDRSRRSDLLLSLGEAMLPTDRCASIAETVSARVLADAEATNDTERVARAALLALEGMWRTSGGPLWGGATDEARRWVQHADAHVAVAGPQRVYVDCWQGMIDLASGQVAPGGAHLRTALARARALGDEAAFVTASTVAINFLQALRDRSLVEELALEMYASRRLEPRMGMANFLLDSLGRALLECGEREAAEQVWRQQAQLAAATGDTALRASAQSAANQRAFLDGDLEHCLLSGESIVADAIPLRHVGLRLTARSLAYLGRAEEIRLEAFESPHRSVQASRALVLSWLGRCEEALALRRRFSGIGASDDETGLPILLSLFETSVRCGDTITAASLCDRLSGLAARLQGTDLVSIGRLLGEAAVMLGKPEAARDYYHQALTVCEKVRFLPELALIRLDLADVLLEHYQQERAAAAELLNSAIADLQGMQMRPAHERALRLLKRMGLPAFETTGVDSLTVRERGVAALLARGMSNREIADALVITENTTQVHVKHILGKLGLKSRSQVAAWAVGQGLAARELVQQVEP
jgi:DNA-binding CsgD family transcriptional regulator